MSERPMANVNSGGCNCGHHGEELPELDARTLPHAVRHGAILGAIDQVQPGAAMVLVAPHDPVPLLNQMRDRFGDSVEVSYLQRGPEAWKLKLAKRLPN